MNRCERTGSISSLPATRMKVDPTEKGVFNPLPASPGYAPLLATAPRSSRRRTGSLHGACSVAWRPPCSRIGGRSLIPTQPATSRLPIDQPGRSDIILRSQTSACSPASKPNSTWPSSAASRPWCRSRRDSSATRSTRASKRRSVMSLLIVWETLENHTIDFRQSSAFTDWRAIVGALFCAPPYVEHFTLVAKRSGLQGRASAASERASPLSPAATPRQSIPSRGPRRGPGRPVRGIWLRGRHRSSAVQRSDSVLDEQCSRRPSASTATTSAEDSSIRSSIVAVTLRRRSTTSSRSAIASKTPPRWRAENQADRAAVIDARTRSEPVSGLLPAREFQDRAMHLHLDTFHIGSPHAARARSSARRHRCRDGSRRRTRTACTSSTISNHSPVRRPAPPGVLRRETTCAGPPPAPPTPWRSP